MTPRERILAMTDDQLRAFARSWADSTFQKVYDSASPSDRTYLSANRAAIVAQQVDGNYVQLLKFRAVQPAPAPQYGLPPVPGYGPPRVSPVRPSSPHPPRTVSPRPTAPPELTIAEARRLLAVAYELFRQHRAGGL